MTPAQQKQIGALGQDAIEVVTVIAAGTVTGTASKRWTLINNAALVASAILNLPASPVDGQFHGFATRNTITAATFGGGTIYGAPGTLTAAAPAGFVYSATAAAWFRTT